MIEDIEAMNLMRLRQPMAALVLGGTAAFFGAMTSAHAFSNPPIQMAQGVEYMCGGTSKDEAAFMQMVSPRWAATGSVLGVAATTAGCCGAATTGASKLGDGNSSITDTCFF